MPKPIAIFNKVRKGDVVAVTVVRSSTDAKFKTTRTKTLTLAYVESAGRDGAAKTIRIAGLSYATAADPAQIQTIGGPNQERAKRLADTLKYPGVEYPDAAALRDAILAAE